MRYFLVKNQTPRYMKLRTGFRRCLFWAFQSCPEVIQCLFERNNSVAQGGHPGFHPVRRNPLVRQIADNGIVIHGENGRDRTSRQAVMIIDFTIGGDYPKVNPSPKTLPLPNEPGTG